MRILFMSLCISILSLSCGSQSKTSSVVPYEEAKNYFVKNTVEDKLLELKITTQEEFDDFFGMARTMGEEGKPTAIDFSTQYVIVVINPVSQDVSGLKCSRLYMKNDKLVLNYEIIKTDKQSFESRHSLMLVLNKEFDKIVEFVND